jgi:hypothetical protein
MLIFNEDKHLVQNNLNDQSKGQTLVVNYGDYKTVNNQDVPSAVSIKSAVANKAISIDLRYTQLGINEALEFPFSVSSRYTVKD